MRNRQAVLAPLLLLVAACTGAIGEQSPGVPAPGPATGEAVGERAAASPPTQAPPASPASIGSPAVAPPAGSPGQTCGSGAAAPTRLWRLSDEQHAAAIRDLL